MNNLPTIIEEAREKFGKRFTLTKEEIEEGWRLDEKQIISFLEDQLTLAYQAGVSHGESSRDQALRTLIEEIRTEHHNGKDVYKLIINLLETLSEK